MSTLSTLIDSYGDLANRYAALEDENAALKARIVELEAQETIVIDLAAYEADRNADHGDAERRIHNLEHALEIAEEDNATLRMRIMELEER